MKCESMIPQQAMLEQLATDAAVQAVRKSPLDAEQLARLASQGSDMRAAITASVSTTLEAWSHKSAFADEEVPAERHTAPKAPKPFVDQITMLRQFFPTLSTVDRSIAEAPLPHGAEGYFAVPRWRAFAATYGEAFSAVLDAIRSQRGEVEFAELVDPARLRLLAKTERALTELAAQQPGHDILVLPAQCGIRHCGRSVRRARAVMPSMEFPLGPLEVAIILLTHPERLRNSWDCWIDSGGCEYDRDADGTFNRALLWAGIRDHLGIGFPQINEPNGCCGSASGFLRH